MKPKTDEEISQDIIRNWLISEKLSLGRVDYPIPKVSYGQLRRLCELAIQSSREGYIKKEDVLKIIKKLEKEYEKAVKQETTKEYDLGYEFATNEIFNDLKQEIEKLGEGK